MAKAIVATYECKQCGSEIVITRTGETQLSPIYCCGLEVSEVSSVEKKPKKKAAKKITKKVAKKKTAKKKKPVSKKKASKK